MSASLYFTNRNNTAAHYISFYSGELSDVTHDLNMSNANARDFLSALGMARDFENTDYEINSFFAALMSFLNSENTEENKAKEEQIHFGVVGSRATMIECGRRADYMNDRAEYALEMTKIAMGKGATHCYFS